MFVFDVENAMLLHWWLTAFGCWRCWSSEFVWLRDRKLRGSRKSHRHNLRLMHKIKTAICDQNAIIQCDYYFNTGNGTVLIIRSLCWKPIIWQQQLNVKNEKYKGKWTSRKGCCTKVVRIQRNSALVFKTFKESKSENQPFVHGRPWKSSLSASCLN